jgi:hypothetical protein
MNAKHRKTLVAIFSRPTSATIVFADIEALIKALGGSISEREGSRVKIELKGEQWRCHRPHPGKNGINQRLLRHQLFSGDNRHTKT